MELTRHIVKPNVEVFFDAAVSDFPSELVGCIWNFGDGSENEYGISVSHVYEAEGDYIVTLKAKDEDSSVDTRMIGVMVIDTDQLEFERWDGYLTVRDGIEIEYALDLSTITIPSAGFPLVVKGHGGIA